MAIHHLRSVTSFIAAGQYCAIVQHWGVDTPTETNPFRLSRLLAQGLDTPDSGDSILEAIQNILSADTFISSIRVQQISPLNSANYVRLYASADWPGAFSGDLSAQQVSACVNWFTASQNGISGRNFFPGVSADALNANRFTDAFKTVVNDLITATVAGVDKDSHDFFPELKTETAGTVFHRITQGMLSSTAGTQRRRLTPM